MALNPILSRRIRQNGSERGAAVFMVVMVLTLVTAIGVFSMRSASLVDLASGYSRQSVQATFVAEYAARAAATYLEGTPSLVSSTMRVPGCGTALLLADPNAPCIVLKTGLIDDSLASTAPRPFLDGISGQLSLPGSPTGIAAEFVTELTEPATASVLASPGFTAGLFKQVTFTSIARVYPTSGALTTVCSAAARGSVSQQTLRAHAIVPL